MDERLTTVHPEPAILALFAAGRLRGGEMERLEGHLLHCEECLAALEQIPEDAMVRMLRDCHLHNAQPTNEPQGESTRGEEPDPMIEGERPSSLSDRQGLTDTDVPDADGTGYRVPRKLAEHPRYRLCRSLGRGGMGLVFLAEDRQEQRPAVLKFLREDLLDQPRLVERFRREAETAVQLRHPNIVETWGAEQFGQWPALVMEYVNGTNLARLLERSGPLPVPVACELMRQTALGLQHSFALGMVHRDIKPANLMVTEEGQVKILDFGLTKMQSELASEPGLTSTGAFLGSIDYMSPEQADDPRFADIRADIYSLGCTLYALLAGHPPFPSGSLWEKMESHAHARHRPLSSIRSDVPAGLEAVVDRMLAKHPSQRHLTPAEVALALAPFTEGVSRGGQVLDVPELKPDDDYAYPSVPALTVVERRDEAALRTAYIGGVIGLRADTWDRAFPGFSSRGLRRPIRKSIQYVAIGGVICLVAAAILKMTVGGRYKVADWNAAPVPGQGGREIFGNSQRPSTGPSDNLIVNGSFEEGPAVNDFLPLNPGSTAIRGWKVIQGQIDYIGNGAHADGKRSLDLHGSPGYGGIEQTFNTTKGQRYRVSFALAGWGGAGFPPRKIGVSAAAQTAAFTFVRTGKEADGMGWAPKEWEFDAVASQTTLEFYTLEESSPFGGPRLDNVRVETVP